MVSYRSEELADDHPFRRIIGALAGPAVLHLELDGLPDATVTRLAADAGLAPGPLVAAVGATPSPAGAGGAGGPLRRRGGDRGGQGRGAS